jgi:HlyD family secretion protein
VGDNVKPGQVIGYVTSFAGSSSRSYAIRAAITGRVVELLVTSGSIVAVGEAIANLEDVSRPLEAVVYVPAVEGEEIGPGMRVAIAPANDSSQPASVLRGVVGSVGPFPASRQAMMLTLANDQLVSEFSANGPLLEVRIRLLANQGAQAEHGEPAASTALVGIDSGSLCTAFITVAERRPIELLLPRQ